MYLRALDQVPESGRRSRRRLVPRPGTPYPAAVEPRFLITGMLAALLILAGGCAAFRVPEPPPTPTPIEPVWSPQELRDHIRFLNGNDMSGRATGTQAYARAAAYVAARLRDYRVQPAVEGDFRLIYSASINYPSSASIRSIGEADSLVYLPGIDFLPDARSDSGEVAVSRFFVAEDSVDEAVSADRPFGVVIPPGTPENLIAWRDAGAAVVVVAGELYPRFRRAPVRGLLTVQMTAEAAAELLNTGTQPLVLFQGRTIEVPRTAHVRVRTVYQPQAGAINILGYLSGKHPAHQRELVILCADLDAAGHFAGVESMDFRNFGIGTAAALEIARNLSFVSSRWSVPERSVMVAIWSGSELGHEGLRYFLDHPTWDLTRVRSMVYLGLDPQEEPAVRALLKPHKIELTTVPPRRDPLFTEEILLLPDQAVRRLARDRNPDLNRIETPDMSTVMDSAVARAAAMADVGYGKVLVQSTDVAPFYPAREDTLAVPPAAGTQ